MEISVINTEEDVAKRDAPKSNSSKLDASKKDASDKEASDKEASNIESSNKEASNKSASNENAADSDPKEETKEKDDKSEFSKRFQNCLPTRRKCYLTATQILLLILMCGTIWGILKEESVPGDELFAIILLASASVVGGKIFGFCKLPPLLGMLIAGFLLKNVYFLPYNKDYSHKISSILRNTSLVIILLRAGLGLCPKQMRQMKAVVFRLSFIPSLAEAGISAVCTHYLLDLPWIWAAMLGFILCAVSPAIIIPGMVILVEKGLGIDKGIPTLVIAASSIDDVIAIAGFGVCFGIAFSTGSLTWTLFKGPLEVLVGIAYGGVLGVIIWHLPDTENEKNTYYKVLVLLFGGLAVEFVSNGLDLSASGALGCLSLSFVAALRWRENDKQFNDINITMATMWYFAQPFLFSLIGAEIEVHQLVEGMGFGILSLVIGIVLRIIITALVTFHADFNIKEKLFVAIAWLPKATVQAALGSLALDLARVNRLGPEIEGYSLKVLTVSVLSILITAPLGALLIALLGPVLLTKSDPPATPIIDDPILENPQANPFTCQLHMVSYRHSV